MAILQVRDIDDRLYDMLKVVSASHNRSLSQEVLYMIQNYLSQPNMRKFNSTQEFLQLSGSWQDDRSSAEIAKDIRKSRTKNKRFGDNNVVFD